MQFGGGLFSLLTLGISEPNWSLQNCSLVKGGGRAGWGWGWGEQETEDEFLDGPNFSLILGYPVILKEP